LHFLLKIFKNLAALLIGVLLIFLLEIFFRQFQPIGILPYLSNHLSLPSYFFLERGYPQRPPSHNFKSLCPNVQKEKCLSILVLGGSSSWGLPFGPTSSFSGRLKTLIENKNSTAHVEVINAAYPSRSSVSALEALKEISVFHPKITLVYTGHNELLPTNYRIKRLAVEMPLFFDLAELLKRNSAIYLYLKKSLSHFNQDEALFTEYGASYDLDKAKKLALREYEKNLKEIVKISKRSNSLPIMMTLLTNISDWESITAPGNTDLDQIDALSDEMSALYEKGSLIDLQTHFNRFQSLFKLETNHSRIHYWLGKIALKKGDCKNARIEFEKALVLDRSTLRALPEINSLIRSVAKSEKVPLIDSEFELSRSTPCHLIGKGLTLDPMHPTEKTHFEIAKRLYAALKVPFSLNPLPSTEKVAIRLNPNALQETAWFYLGIKRFYQALSYFKKIPNTPSSQGVLLGKLLAELGLNQMAAAAKTFKELNNIEPINSKTIETRIREHLGSAANRVLSRFQKIKTRN